MCPLALGKRSESATLRSFATLKELGYPEPEDVDEPRPVPNKETRRLAAELERSNALLRADLDRCRALLEECRAKSAANSNQENDSEIEEQAAEGSRPS
jgi:hypothetical protein